MLAANYKNAKPDTQAFLVLSNGMVFRGDGFGAKKTSTGEVVFNTGMVGYCESITDPSYKGQILCQTYPMIGNYGVDPDSFESDKPKIEGYLIHELCESPSHRTSVCSLNEWLSREGIPGITGIDTRTLTKTLRIHGVMLGVISNDGTDPEKLKEIAKNMPNPNEIDLVSEVTTKEPKEYNTNGKMRVVILDCGAKENIIRSLVARDVHVIRVPANFNADKIMSYNPDGILISNGPGDPKKVDYAIETTKNLIEYKIPIFGICLGVQLLALALGGNTYKLKFGHRGQNHPVIDANNRCYITSQNHGFAVDVKNCEDVKVTMTHGNDKSIEGVAHTRLPVFGVQFHPEAAPGPVDTGFLFDKFVRMAR
ncbi:MAG: glutamine-hydrolyzing carbamoyl-phosphate synthase small subunit [Candidatus Aenigmatarchaeota archaeon]